MTLSTTTSSITYDGDGNNKTFAYTFKIKDEDHLVVTLSDDDGSNPEILVKTTDYTVTGVGEAAGGNVVLTAGRAAPASDEHLTIDRVVPLTQLTDLEEQGSWLAETHEDVFDYLMMVNQQQQDEIDRCFKISSTADEEPDDFDGTVEDLYNAISASAALCESYKDDAEAAAAGVSLPSINPGDADKVLVVKATEDGYELLASLDSFTLATPTLTGTVTVTSVSFSGACSFASAVTFDAAVEFDGAVVCDSTLELNGALSGSSFLDEDDMSSDSATAVASQQSIKAYVDSEVTALSAPSWAQIVQSTASGGSNGQSLSSGSWANALELTSLEYDDDSIVTAFRNEDAGSNPNQFELAAGTYEIDVNCQFNNTLLGTFKLRNVSDGSDVLFAMATRTATAITSQNMCRLFGRFTIADTKAFELRYWVSNAGNTGYDMSSGEDNIFMMCNIKKL